MTNKERLLYQAAINILYYNCPDETEEPECERCWLDYLLDMINR